MVRESKCTLTTRTLNIFFHLEGVEYETKRSWLELVKDYDVETVCHPGKANVVADTLSRNQPTPLHWSLNRASFKIRSKELGLI